MNFNVGTIDRLARIVLGAALLYLAFASGLPLFEGPLLKYGAAVVGVIMIVTAAAGRCPLYSVFGIRTCRTG